MPNIQTRKIQQDDPRINSDDTAQDDYGYHRLSYLAGSITHGGTNDVGDVAANTPYEWGNRDKQKAREFLLRHTYEPGALTFSWPQKP